MTGEKEKTAVLFDVDDTLYDQTVPFMEAYAEFFGPDPDIPAEVIYPVTRKYSDQMFSRAMSGEMSMDEMYIYRVQKAFEEFGIGSRMKRRWPFSACTPAGRITSGCRRLWKTFLHTVTGGPSWALSRTVRQTASGIR